MKTKTNHEYEVLVVGDYCLDFVFTGLPGEPILGSEIEASNFNMTPGGTCNAAVSMHRLGVKVGWAADFGMDNISKFILDYLHKENFPSDLFEYHEKQYRKVTVSLSYKEERAFIAYYDSAKFMLSAIKHLPFVTAKVLYVPGLFYGPELEWGSKLLRKKSTLIFMDGNSNKSETLSMQSIKKAFRAVDILSLNAEEAYRITGIHDIYMASDEICKYCPHIIIKDGKQGAIANWDGVMYKSQAIRANTIDTTGAGDCFNAGFIKAYLTERPIQECLDWGNIVGGLSTEGLGGISRIVHVEDVKKRLKR